MANTKIKIDDKLEFTKDLTGVCPVKKSDKLIYLGNSQAKIITGASIDWLVWLCIDSPVILCKK